MTRPVTSSRIGRLSMLGKLAGGIVGGMVSEGARQLAQGKRPSIGNLILTPGNASRLTQRLSEMRGAAMKIGQLLSMDSGQILPPELSDVLGRLRDSAHQMPRAQVDRVLQQAWGATWQRRFSHFDFNPIAAASIGQVHRARLPDGQLLAVKIQYPGVRRSIDSDVDNVAALLRTFKLIPNQRDVQALLAEAKAQLHVEADYRKEALALDRYAGLARQDLRLAVPDVVESLSSSEVLTMTFMAGLPIESLADRPAAERDNAVAVLLELALREVFDWGYVQTDPNFANFRYQPNDARIQLLDFGATREYSAQQRLALRALLGACIDGDDSDIETAAAGVGYVDRNDPAGYRNAIIALLRMASEPARARGRYDFGSSDLAERMRERLVRMRLHHHHWRMPPVGVLFLHRKLGGLYMLFKRLRARADVPQLIDRLGTATDRAVGSLSKPSIPDRD